jgi:ABC-2 type transport system permease protein
MTAQLAALISSHLSDRRRSLQAWGLPLGLMAAFIVAIFPSVEDSISKVVEKYPSGLKEAFGIGQLSNVEQYLHAEMLSLIVPLALGYLAVRAVASGLAGAAETGRLDVLLSAPVSRRRLCAAGFLATAIELAAVLAISFLLTMLGSVLSGAGLDVDLAAAGFAAVWPLALLFAGLGILACAWSLRTSVVTGAVAGILVAMYVGGPDRQARSELRLAALRLGIQVLRKRDRRGDPTGRFSWRHRSGRHLRRARRMAV